MGSKDVEVQFQAQSASGNLPCESASYGIASMPFITPMSVAHSQAGTPTPASVCTTMLAHSAASHTPPQNVASVAASPLPHVQVIQQPLQNQYLQHLYAPQQQHMFLPSNLTLQPTLQSIGGAQGISLQLQGKPMDNKGSTPTLISAGPMQQVGNFSTQSLMPATGQLTAGAKTCVQGQMLAASSKSTVIQGQSAFIPTTSANQTVVIGQLGVLSNQPSVIPHQAKAITDGQKGKSFLISQPALHPKSPILPSPNVSCAGQMIATSQLKQLPHAPHVLSTTQAPTMIASQAQILGSLQALGASLPQGITWAAPGSLHSPALFGQNPIFIRSHQSDMFIQSPPPQATIHAVPVAPAPQQQQQQQLQVPPPPPSTPAPPVQKLKQVRPASSVATQTTVSTSTSTSNNATVTKTHMKQRSRALQSRGTPAIPPTQLMTATTQTQTHPQPSLKADAANQTKPTSEPKLIAPTPTFNKSSSTETQVFVPPQSPYCIPKVTMTKINVSIEPMEALPVPDIAIVAPSPILPVQEVKQVEVPKEPPIVQIPVEKVMPNRKEVEVENIRIVAPISEPPKDKQPQKAIVKPHVLTHVIEGFVIQEGSEPFPVNRPTYGNKNISKDQIYDDSSEAVPSNQNIDVLPKKKEKIPKIRGPVELAKCEFCGKLGPKSKFKRSKRFCSTSCAKRYNVGCSKRLAIVLPEQEQKPGEEIRRHKKKSSSKKVGRSKKKKLGLKSKKAWRKAENRIYEVQDWNAEPQEVVEEAEEEKILPPEEPMEESPDIPMEEVAEPSSGADSSASSPPEKIVEEEQNMESNLEFSTKSPLKWTVSDVVDFVRNLPGCSDYADEFGAQEIDGQALLLLKEDHLMSLMSMKLGPALKVCARINSIKDEVNH